MGKPCGRRVYWWDCDMETSCLRDPGHKGLHYDGLRYYTDDGFQKPDDPEPWWAQQLRSTS